MSTIRIPTKVWNDLRTHLFSSGGEHFAFLQADWTLTGDGPVFMVKDVSLVPDAEVNAGYGGWELTTQGIINVVNAAVRSGLALIEAHNHGGLAPRFSTTDRSGLEEFVPYILDSLPGRPYGATVWGDDETYGEFFLESGSTGTVRSITVSGEPLRQIVSRNDDQAAVSATFERQLPLFTESGQRELGRLRAAIVGLGGTGSQMVQNLTYLGVHDFVLVDAQCADGTNMNRLVTADSADVSTPKVILARHRIKSVTPDADVRIFEAEVQGTAVLDCLKGIDVLFGCVDNDGARLVLNELSLAYGIPYFDLGVGIDAAAGSVESAGGRVAVVLPDGPCLNCMGEIDIREASFFLSSQQERDQNVALGYVDGHDLPAPAVVSLNATVAAIATSEFMMLVSGTRPIHSFTELDLLGTSRPIASQWVTPRRVERKSGCVQCAAAGKGDKKPK